MDSDAEKLIVKDDVGEDAAPPPAPSLIRSDLTTPLELPPTPTNHSVPVPLHGVLSPAFMRYDSPLVDAPPPTSAVPTSALTCRTNGAIINESRSRKGDDVMHTSHRDKCNLEIPVVVEGNGGSYDDHSSYCYPNESTPLTATSSPVGQQKVYTVRWYVLWLFCLATFMQGVGWGSFGPITQSCKSVFGWEDSNITLMALSANVVFVMCAIPFSWLMETKGMRASMIFSVLLLAVGFSVRCISMHAPWATWTMLIGQSLIGGGAVVPFSGVSMLSSLWFPLNQRTTATSLTTATGFLGTAIIFVIGPKVVPEDSNNDTGNISVGFNGSHHTDNATFIEKQRDAIAMLMYSEAGIAVLTLLLILIYFPAKPPTPPTLSAHTERLNLRQGMNGLIRNRQFILVLLAYTVGCGVFGAFSIIIDIDLKPIGVSQTTAGWIGFYGTVGSCACCFVVSWLSDIYMRKLKFLLLMLLFPALIAFVLFFLLVGSYIPYNEVALYAATIVPAICILGSSPLFYELACELVYPIGEGLTTLVLTMTNNVLGAAFLGMFSIPNIGVIWMNYAFIVSVIVAIVLLLMTRLTYRRTNVDAQEIIIPPPSADNDGHGIDDLLSSSLLSSSTSSSNVIPTPTYGSNNVSFRPKIQIN